MKKLLSFLSLVLASSCLLGCESVNLSTGENIFEAGDYKFVLNTNTDYMEISFAGETKDNYTKYLEDTLKGEEKKFINVSTLNPVAHENITSKDDYLLPTTWYYGTGASISDGTMVEGSKKYVEESTMNSYLIKFEFEISLTEASLKETYDINVSNITFPDNNIFSSIVIGSEGYQEINSIGGGLVTDGYIGTISKSEKTSVIVLLYIDGNDERVTLENLNKMGLNHGTISISVDLH